MAFPDQGEGQALRGQDEAKCPVVHNTDRGLLPGIEPFHLWRGGSGPYQAAWVWTAEWVHEIDWSGPSKLAWLSVSSFFLGSVQISGCQF